MAVSDLAAQSARASVVVSLTSFFLNITVPEAEGLHFLDFERLWCKRILTHRRLPTWPLHQRCHVCKTTISTIPYSRAVVLEPSCYNYFIYMMWIIVQVIVDQYAYVWMCVSIPGRGRLTFSGHKEKAVADTTILWFCLRFVYIFWIMSVKAVCRLFLWSGIFVMLSNRNGYSSD